MDGLEKIKANCKCCISGKPLSTSGHVNMIQLDKKATWPFPVWGNVITGRQNMAVSYVHDDYCHYEKMKLKGEIKYAVELRGEEFIYHPIESLRSE